MLTTARETHGKGRYYRARYYDAAAGRFLSEDPAGFRGGANFYLYTGSSPTNLTDPSGLLPSGDNDKLQPKPWDFRDIIIAMLKDPGNNDCKCWFKTGKRSINELIGIVSNVPIVFIEEPLGSGGGDTTDDPRSPIRINTNGSFYPWGLFAVGHTPDGQPIYGAGTFEAQMVIPLHEFAHKTMPQGFKDDDFYHDPNGKLSAENTNLLIEKCKNAIKWLKSSFQKK